MVLVVMDIADVVLCSGKCLKYLGKRFNALCDFVFGIFLIVWIATRHIAYAYIMWSIHVEARAEISGKSGIWDPWMTRIVRSADDATRPGSYYSERVIDMYLLHFAALQCLLIYWFSLILKIVVGVIRGGQAGDVREDE
jgi:acyl-CoA-dependent ceramide synthase